MPWHRRDRPARASAGSASCRSGRRAAGSARRTPTRPTRLGIRVQDLLDPKILRQKIEVALAEKNVWLERVYGAEPFDLDDRRRALRGLRASGCGRCRRHVAARRPCAPRREARALRGRARDAARPRPRHVSLRHVVANRRRRARQSGPASGRPGSTPSSASRRRTSRASARVPFPSEIEGPDQERLRELGGEFGTVTGRERRCGWLDLVALRYAVRAERHDLARADEARRAVGLLRAAGLRPLPAARRHRDRGLPGPPERLPPLPSRSTRRSPGWQRAARRADRGLASCPPAARAYVELSRSGSRWRSA